MPGQIFLNPEIFNDKRDAMATAWNEALRLVQEDAKFTPVFEVTPEQKAFFKDTAYATNSLALKRTIVSRIATHDTSVSPTEEQEMETIRLLALVMEMIGPKHQDYPVVQKMSESVQAGNARGEIRAAPAAQAGVSQEPPADGALGPPPPEDVATQAAAAGGDVRHDYTETIKYALSVLPLNEGFLPVAEQRPEDTPRKDGSRPWTVGYGITELADGTRIKEGDTMDERTASTRAEEIMVKRLFPVAEKNVSGWFGLDPRLQAAMTDTAYNVGPRYFQDIPEGSPKMLKRFRKGEDPATVISEENKTWKRANGIVLPGLVSRRKYVDDVLIAPTRLPKK